MPVTEHDVYEAKQLRNSAHEVFATQKAMVRADLNAASVGQRVSTRLSEEGKLLASEASETASQHPQAIAAGAVAIGALLFRKPLLAGLAAIIGMRSSDDEDDHDEDRPGGE